MNYRMIGIYKRSMNPIEKFLVGWCQVLDNSWEWWYPLTQAEPEDYFEFWMILNQDMVKFTEEIYYNGEK
jgi:hypothetical protein